MATPTRSRRNALTTSPFQGEAIQDRFPKTSAVTFPRG
jgi:hypothetical protein